MDAEVRKRIRWGKPMGATSFVAIPIEKYENLTYNQKEQIRFFDPFLRPLHQVGVGLVYIFWLDEKQMNIISQTF